MRTATAVASPPRGTASVVPSGPVEVGTRYSFTKRTIDILVSGVMLVLLLPTLAVVALSIRATLGPGSPIIVQERVGRDGEVFRMYKFRTMLRDRRERNQPFDGPDRRRAHKSDDDPRHRPWGRLLRRSSIDEIPQLVNVLKGDMSLVGPRPELVSVATSRHMLGHARELVRPGITGPFQVSELRKSGDLRKGLRLDAMYVGQMSLTTDLKLIAKTVVVMFRRTGC